MRWPQWVVTRPRETAFGRAANQAGSDDGRLLDAVLVGAALGLLAVTPAVIALAWLTDEASLPTQRLLVTCLGIVAGLTGGAVRHRRRQHQP